MPEVLQFFPYPHERKIYLTKNQMNHEYFFTSIVTSEKDEIEYIEKMFNSYTQKDSIAKEGLEKSASVKEKLNY